MSKYFVFNLKVFSHFVKVMAVLKRLLLNIIEPQSRVPTNLPPFKIK